jgi:hypothetical protein
LSLRQTSLSRFAAACALLGALLCAQTSTPPSGTAATVDTAVRIVPPPETHRWPNHQTYHYAVEWRIFNAGTATLRMEPAGREHRLVSTADSAGFVGLLYRVHDRVESFFDPSTFCSRSVSKRTEEGRRRLDTQITFDYARSKSLLTEKNLKDSTTKREEHEIPVCVTDVVSSIYYLASLPLADKTTYHFPMNDGGNTAHVKATVEGREAARIPAGTFKTVRILVTSDTGKLKDKGQLEIWFTDDPTRVPVQMRARLFWGTLMFRLQRIETSAK